MGAAAAVQSPPPLFPEKEIESVIEMWWEEQTSKHVDDPFGLPGTLFDVLVEIDSLTAVNVLLVIEPVIGLQPPESLIRPGGYTDRSDMIGHLMPRLRKLFNQRKLKSTDR